MDAMEPQAQLCVSRSTSLIASLTGASSEATAGLFAGTSVTVSLNALIAL